MTLGQLIKHHRRVLGLDQSELAHLFQTGAGTIASWEADKQRPSLHNMARLATILHVDIAVLMEADAPKPARQIESQRVQGRMEAVTVLDQQLALLERRVTSLEQRLALLEPQRSVPDDGLPVQE